MIHAIRLLCFVSYARFYYYLFVGYFGGLFWWLDVEQKWQMMYIVQYARLTHMWNSDRAREQRVFLLLCDVGAGRVIRVPIHNTK